MNKLLYSKYGCWIVSGITFDDKISALEYASLTKSKVRFYYHDHVWDKFDRMNWEDYYIGNTNVIDAAVLWKENNYIPGTFMCLSFQFKKHLSLGRGGIILLDNEKDYTDPKAMVYDGRERDIL